MKTRKAIWQAGASGAVLVCAETGRKMIADTRCCPDYYRCCGWFECNYPVTVTDLGTDYPCESRDSAIRLLRAFGWEIPEPPP